ncbi:hypothetical protein RhiirA1_438722 [Rhizophagus irregularis]|uniref:G-protein coupled receptors family 2 profile 2 domain-containing protein n=2 Tax=Rhizophagus irregularis TaxID=588596 RepID=A0A2N0S867_9GLOM|nr:hypothetical protein RhiirA1_438722 [Rhizophagus irregularis]CAB4377304.1 unnamed protein product [Rhizophagus irregularis]CAB5101185.1 unnamed protein product [Rhizophagus irregularis]CAB5383459.1 unnamed protein product [Rhizophagus irregularis]
MVFESDAIAFYAFHVTSLPLSLLLFVIYKNHKYHSTIAYFALTLIFSSINSCFLAFAKNGDIKNSANTLACDIQAFFISYLNSSAAIWPVCIQSNMTLILLKRRKQQSGWAGRQILLSFMALAWGLPMFFTIASFVLAVSEEGLKPWSYYCMLSEPAIGPAIGIYFVSLCAIIVTIIISAWNVKLVCNETENIELSKRIITFGIIATLPVCLATIARSFNVIIYKIVDANGTWPDFLLITIPYLTFIIFGTSSELISKILPSSSPCKRNRGDSLLLRFSIVNPTLIRRETMDDREQRLSLTLAMEKSSLEEQATYLSTPGPSTFSQRTNPNAPDPFSHRKNPSLTINVSPNNNNNNRTSKGKRTSVSIRQSFLARALSINKGPDNSYLSSTKTAENNNINSRSLRKVMKTINLPKKTYRRGNRFSNMLNNNRSAFYFDTADGKPRFLKTFSFENRKRTESVIGIPQEYVVDNIIDVPELPDKYKKNIRNSTYYAVERENERRERLARKEQLLHKYNKPPPLALKQNRSLPSNPKSPSFFFLNPNHYDNDQYTDLPVTPSFGTPSFGVASSSKAQNRYSLSSKSNKSNNSMNSSKSSHGGGGLRLTPRNSIPVNILNRKSLIDALPR